VIYGYEMCTSRGRQAVNSNKFYNRNSRQSKTLIIFCRLSTARTVRPYVLNVLAGKLNRRSSQPSGCHGATSSTNKSARRVLTHLRLRILQFRTFAVKLLIEAPGFY